MRTLTRIRIVCIFLLLVLPISSKLLASGMSVTSLRAMVNGAEAQAANEAYQKHNYGDALKRYRKLLKHVVNVDLLFNAGNAAFKTEQLGLAIYYWMRAQRLSPRDLDVVANLTFARSLCKDKAPIETEGSFSRFMEAVYRYPSLVEIEVCLFILSWCLAAFVAIRAFARGIVLRELALWSSGIFIVLLLLCAFWTGLRVWEWETQLPAVVVSNELQALSEPSDGSTRVFVLHEGTDVEVRRKSRKWAQVSLPNGYSGWVHLDGLILIAPEVRGP